MCLMFANWLLADAAHTVTQLLIQIYGLTYVPSTLISPLGGKSDAVMTAGFSLLPKSFV